MLRLPWGSGQNTPTPWIILNGTNGAVSHAPHHQRGHRRTVSDGILFAPPSTSMPERVQYPSAPFGGATGEVLDLERGDTVFEKLVPNAILSVNDSPKALG
jgi:hypothetical protein